LEVGGDDRIACRVEVGVGEMVGAKPVTAVAFISAFHCSAMSKGLSNVGSDFALITAFSYQQTIASETYRAKERW